MSWAPLKELMEGATHDTEELEVQHGLIMRCFQRGWSAMGVSKSAQPSWVRSSDIMEDRLGKSFAGNQVKGRLTASVACSTSSVSTPCGATSARSGSCPSQHGRVGVTDSSSVVVCQLMTQFGRPNRVWGLPFTLPTPSAIRNPRVWPTCTREKSSTRRFRVSV